MGVIKLRKWGPRKWWKQMNKTKWWWWEWHALHMPRSSGRLKHTTKLLVIGGIEEQNVGIRFTSSEKRSAGGWHCVAQAFNCWLQQFIANGRSHSTVPFQLVVCRGVATNDGLVLFRFVPKDSITNLVLVNWLILGTSATLIGLNLKNLKQFDLTKIACFTVPIES